MVHHVARPVALPAVTCDDVSHTILPALEHALQGRGPAVTPLGTGPDVDRIRGVLAPGRPLERSGVAAVLPTSGSTGEPKLALLGASALTASAHATHERLGGPGTWLLALPVTRVGGLQVLVRSLLAGTSPEIVIPSAGGFTGAFVEGTLRLRERAHGQRHTRAYTALVPAQLSRLLRSGAATEALTAYDRVLLGGGPASTGLLSSAREAGVRVVTTYGMTETCGGCVYDGRALPGVRVELDEQGRVRIGGPVLFSGYRGRPDLTASALVGGRHLTQDLGRFDGSGRLEIIGRVDEIVVSGGVNVPLPAVDAVLVGLPGVADAAAAGAPDPEWGTKVVAYVVLRPGAKAPSLREVRDRVSAVHPRSYAPKELYVVDELPLLPSGKLDRAALPTPPPPSPPPNVTF